MAMGDKHNHKDNKELQPLLVFGPPTIFPIFEAQNSHTYRFLKAFSSQFPLHQFLTEQKVDPSSIQAILCNPIQKIPADVIRLLPSLRIIVTSSAGTDHIDLVECSRHNIQVVSAAADHAGDVAEMAVGLLLDVMGKISAADRYVRKWGPSMPLNLSFGSKLKGKRVGIVGLGKIGTAVAKRLEAFDCRIMYNSRNQKPLVSYPFYSNVVELAGNSDVLVLCCPLNEQTRHITNREVMLALGKDGFIVNVGRGALIDEKELVQCLMEGEIGGAGLDVFEFKRLFRDSKNDPEDRAHTKTIEYEDKEGFFRKLFREKSEDRKDGSERNDNREATNFDDKYTKPAEEDEKEGFFRKLLKDKFEDKKDTNDKIEEGTANGEEEESSEFSLFKRLFRVHPEDTKSSLANANINNGGLVESSPGTDNFFRKLFRDRDRSIEDSELFGPKRQKEKHPGSPTQQSEKSSTKPPLPINPSQFRKGAYHDSLEFVQSLCDTSYGLVDVFPIEDRKSALREALVEINLHVAKVQNTGGVCFPLGKGMYRVLNIPEDEAVLLNSREKAPFLICVEVLRCEMPSNSKEASSSQKLSQGGIPLANGDALLQRPPPWAYPLRTAQEVYRNSNDRMSSSTAHAIDQAMTHVSEAKIKFVSVNLSAETQLNGQPEKIEVVDLHGGSQRSASIHRDGRYDEAAAGHGSDLEWVHVVLTADPGVRLEDIEEQAPPRRKEHRRVPSTVAIEEVKAAAAKGEAPLGLPLKGAGQDSSDAQPRANGITPKASDALSGELWEAKKDRICKASIYGKLPGWDLRSVIVKSGDDCRQEHLAVQLISHFYDIFQEAGLPLWLRPYEVLCTSSYTAVIETIPDTASLHSIKSRYPNISSLREFFSAKYQENSPGFKLAQRNFVESMAGYSLVCYFLQVKDRHNGNLLLDEEGHIIHIDFGFMLSNSPGGVNFESAPFKLTRELLEVMDSDAEGVPSEFFDYFKVLCIQGFLTCRKHAERIILLVEMLQDSGFPCFKGGARTIQNLRKRFHLNLTEEQCVSLVLSLISSSLDAWRTRQYDYYQRVLNGIL